MLIRMLDSETEGDDVGKGDGEEGEVPVLEDGRGKADAAATRGVGGGGGDEDARVLWGDNVRALLRWLNYSVGDDESDADRAWSGAAYGLVLGSALAALHFVNYRVTENLVMFLALLAAIPLLALKTLRNNLSDTRRVGSWGRTYAIVFDCLVQRSFLRNHLVLTLCILLVRTGKILCPLALICQYFRVSFFS